MPRRGSSSARPEPIAGAIMDLWLGGRVGRCAHGFSMALPDPSRSAPTKAALASADNLWREEMRWAYGPDAVLAYYGHAPQGQGGLGPPLRRSYEARRVAVALWRRERHRAA